MRAGSIILIVSLFYETAFPQTIANKFFPLHNIIAGDSLYNTYDKQIALVKTTGYDGIEINDFDNFADMKAALDKQAFPAIFLYVQINLDSPCLNNKLKDEIGQLAGNKTIIAPYIIGRSGMAAGDPTSDSLLVRRLSQLAGWAGQAGLEVAIYPHFGFYIARCDQALSIVKKVRRKNLGLCFNLCHWLATTSLSQRSELKSLLRELSPYLKMITICGANDTISRQRTIWDDYILPLGSGSFDTYGLVKYCVQDLRLRVPIGVQCFNIKTDNFQLVQQTMQVWRQYEKALASVPILSPMKKASRK
jgi:sugar phosphate isomerase/epimerase